MDRVLTAKGNEMLDMLPPYLRDDPAVQAFIDVNAREFERRDVVLADLHSKLRPQNADDTYNTLGLWETLLELPVKPTDISIEARRQKVLVAFESIAEGRDWVGAITDAVGSEDWSHTESGYVVSIIQPHPLGTYQAEVVAKLARRITPAHLDVVVSDGDGFIVGVSLLGVDIL